MDTAASLVVLTTLVLFVLYLAVLIVVHRTTGPGNTELMQRVAQDRAEALLRDVLTVTEYAQLGERGYLEVRSPSQPTRTYRVPRKPGRVAVQDDGVETELLCVGPTEWLPPSDLVLAHKLMIEGNEQEYLRRANHRLLRTPDRILAGGR